MNKKLILIITSLLLIFTLTDFSEISSADSLESAMMVSAISIGYEKGQYDMSFIYLDWAPEKNGRNEYRIISAVSPTIGGCIDCARRDSRENLFFGQTDAVFLEEDLIKNEEVYSSVMDFLERDPYIGYSIYIFATHGEISSFNSLIKDKDASLTEFLDNIIIKDPLDTLICTRLTDTLSGYSYVIPEIYPGNQSKILSLLSVDGRKYSGFIGESDFITYSVINAKKGEYCFETPLGEFAVKNIKRRLSFDGNIITVSLTGEFSTIVSDGYTSIQGKMIALSEEMVERSVESSCGEFVDMMKKTSCDMADLEEYLHRFHPSALAYCEKEHLSFAERYPITIHADLKLVGNGIMY